MSENKAEQTIFTPVGPCVVKGDKAQYKMTFYCAGITYQFVSKNGIISSFWKTGMLAEESYKNE